MSLIIQTIHHTSMTVFICWCRISRFSTYLHYQLSHFIM